MANHHADAAIVFGIRCFGIEEGVLKYGCGEHNFVGQRVIVGVDGLGCHAPFGLVDGLAPLRKLFFVMPHACVVDVAVIRKGRVDFHCRVVFPLVGIADFHSE